MNLIVLLTYWEEPKQYIISKDISEILHYTPVVRRCGKVRIRFDPLLAILDGRVLFGDQPEVKEEEAGNGHKKYHDLIPTFYTENFSDVDAAILLENQSVIKSCFAF